MRDVPDARFVILGEGDLRPALERQIKDLHLEKHVLLPGFRADILSFIRSFDVFVMSSLFEGLGTSLLDAMALSKPTVASDTGGIPEVVSHGETGLAGSAARCARACRRPSRQLLKDPERRERMGRAGLERVKRLFSADQMVEKTLGVYRRIGTQSDEPTISDSAYAWMARAPQRARLNPPARG